MDIFNELSAGALPALVCVCGVHVKYARLLEPTYWNPVGPTVLP
jgi:hypothetical protein